MAGLGMPTTTMNAAMPVQDPNKAERYTPERSGWHHDKTQDHLSGPDQASGRKSFESVASFPGTTPSYRSSISSINTSTNTNPTTHSTPSTLKSGTIYTFHVGTSSKRNIHIKDPAGLEVLWAKISQHNPLKPDIQFYKGGTVNRDLLLGAAKLRHSKDIKLHLYHGAHSKQTGEREMSSVSKERNYEFQLPHTAGKARICMWKRTGGKGEMRYELVTEGHGEVLAILDGEKGGDDFKRATLIVGEGLEFDVDRFIGEGALEQGLWVVMSAVGICEKARRRGEVGK